jgi:hypothetical protein
MRNGEIILSAYKIYPIHGISYFLERLYLCTHEKKKRIQDAWLLQELSDVKYIRHLIENELKKTKAPLQTDSNWISGTL